MTGIADSAVIFPDVQLGDDVTVFPGAVLGRPPMSSGAAHQWDIESLEPLVIAGGCIIGCNAVIYSGSRIGPNSMICDNACVRERVVIGEQTVVAMGVTINYGTRVG